MYTLEGGSFGLQLGAESTDVVLLVMNNRGVDALLSSKVKLGGNASAAAGPKGRNIEASTDATMRAEILSYSRSRGLFAGVSLEGTSLRPDDDATEEVYGRKLTARTIVTGKRIAVPESARHLVAVLQKNAPHNESAKPDDSVTSNQKDPVMTLTLPGLILLIVIAAICGGRRQGTCGRRPGRPRRVHRSWFHRRAPRTVDGACSSICPNRSWFTSAVSPFQSYGR